MDERTSEHVVIEMTPPSSGTTIGNKRAASSTTTTYLYKTDTNSRRQQLRRRDKEFNTEMVRRAIADTGRWAFGAISVEVWVVNESTGKLERPKAAFWFDPVIVNENGDNEALMRLVDMNRDDFVAPDPLAPGIGLAGALWKDLARNARVRNRSVVGNFGQSETIMPGNPRRVVWREVEPISVDPDQPYNLRLQLAVQAGVAFAAGVPYEFRGTRGLVLYMARKNADLTKLKSETNEQYLLSATDVIGSIVSLSGPRNILLEERRADREAIMRRLRLKMIAIVRIKGNVGFANSPKESDTSTANSDQDTDSAEGKRTSACLRWKKCLHFVKMKLAMIARKCRGANNEPPPPMTSIEALWSFCGAFLSLLMLLKFSDAISTANPKYSLVTGPFGALMTLQYCLTAAPASQPRNAILGQAISLSIALGVTYTRLSKMFRQALGTALAIMVMARTGVTHPPAGAAALIFSGGGYSWGHFGIMLAGNLLAIFSATIVNDMNVKRQYPTFWGFGYWCKHFQCKKKKIE